VISSVSLVHGTIIIFDFLYYIQTSFFPSLGLSWLRRGVEEENRTKSE
jgi:hypothetical protein